MHRYRRHVAPIATLVNPLGTLLLEQVHATLAFIGCSGVDGGAGATDINLPEAEIKRAMLLAARPVLVADASKLGEVELAKICDVGGEASLLVTSGTATPTSFVTSNAPASRGDRMNRPQLSFLTQGRWSTT